MCVAKSIACLPVAIQAKQLGGGTFCSTFVLLVNVRSYGLLVSHENLALLATKVVVTLEFFCVGQLPLHQSGRKNLGRDILRLAYNNV